jgi:hypothetical protein
MTAYTTIANALVAVGAKPFATTIQALRDNILAGLECDATAPTNHAAWHPYNRFAAGSTNTGRIYNFGTDGAVSTVITPDYVDGYEYRIRFNGVQPGATAVDLQIENYRETDATYSAAHALGGSFAAAALVSGYIELPSVRISQRTHVFRAYFQREGANAAVAAVTADRADQFTTAQPILRSRVRFVGTTFQAGQIFLERRRVY